jgi:hypothetical protein
VKQSRYLLRILGLYRYREKGNGKEEELEKNFKS